VTARFDYDRTALEGALRHAGLAEGDLVLVHLSMGRLGRLKEGMTLDVMNQTMLDAFSRVLGRSGTLCVPTYTYSLGSGQVYDPATTPSTVGPFTEYFRLRPSTPRSRDPMLSTAASGPMAERLLAGLPPTCMGAGSFFDRFRAAGGKICTLGVDLHWATFRHHIEEIADVPFRRPKKFLGRIVTDGEIREEEWTYFAAAYLPNCAPHGQPLADAVKAAGIAREFPVGRSTVVVIGAADYFAYGYAALKANPWLTAAGPPCSEAEVLAAMNR
jgi:aminoglycoside 3-N-acetyltransferase